MNNGGLYKNVKMSLTSANIAVICAIALLVFCFIFAVSTAEKTTDADAEYSTDIQDRTE